MKKITVKSNGMDVNGNKKYLYNFIDTDKSTPTGQKQVNDLFKYFGRRTTKGISNQVAPQQMQEWLQRPFINFDIVDLSKAQKDIDRCNSKSGCNAYCGLTRQSECSKLQKHAMLIDTLNYVGTFLKLDIEEVEV